MQAEGEVDRAGVDESECKMESRDRELSLPILKVKTERNLLMIKKTWVFSVSL